MGLVFYNNARNFSFNPYGTNYDVSFYFLTHRKCFLVGTHEYLLLQTQKNMRSNSEELRCA